MSKEAPRLQLACILTVLIAAAIFPSLVRAEFDRDIRLWQTLGINFYEDDDWRISAAAQSRLFDEGKFLGAWLLFPTAQYKLHPNLDLGATYLFEDIRGECGVDYTRLHIFWLHASPHWQLNQDWKFSMRHVLGLRAVEGSADYWISRHKFALSYKVKDMGRLIAISADTELFYNYDDNRLFENRLVPLKATFKITDKSKLSLYFMAQSKRFANSADWETAYVFGQSLSYKW